MVEPRHPASPRPSQPGSRHRYLYITGISYCGSTLMSFLLNAHPQMVCIGEESGPTRKQHRATYPCSCGETLGTCGFWRGVRRGMEVRGHEFGPSHWRIGLEVGKHPAVRRLVSRSLHDHQLDHLRDQLVRCTPGLRSALADHEKRNAAFVDTIIEQTGADVFVGAAKDPVRIGHLLRIPTIDLFVMHLVRDSPGVVTSRMRHSDSSLSEAIALWMRTIENTERMLQLVPADRVIQVRYEDLCRDPQAELGRITDFVGLSPHTFPVEFRDVEHHVIGNAMRLGTSSEIRLDTRWKSALSEAQVETVLVRTGALRRRLGYGDEPGKAVGSTPWRPVKGPPELLSARSCVVISANRGFALTRSRGLLIERLLKAGVKVVLATADDEHSRALVAKGAVLEPVVFNRNGLTLDADIEAQRRMIRIYLRYRPDLVHHFHAKPVLMGTIAAMLVPGITVVNTITGLGHAFIEGGFVRHLAAAGYKTLLDRSATTIFQNPDDMQMFIEQGWVTSDLAHLIIGSGVDVEEYRPAATPSQRQTPIVLMAARFRWQKGIAEYVEAAKLLKQRGVAVRVELAGEEELDHPDGVDSAFLHAAAERGDIDLIGYVHDMPTKLREVDVLVLPSYREGVPRAPVEAAASGIPVIVADAAGSREAVRHGETGLIVPQKDATALADAIEHLVANPELRRVMGEAGRRFAVSTFDVRAITEKHLAIYREVGFSLDEAK